MEDISLRHEGLHIVFMSLNVNEDFHKGSNMTLMVRKKIH